MENDYTEFLKLYKLSNKPYSPSKTWTTEKEFTPSYELPAKPVFVLEELKKINTNQ